MAEQAPIDFGGAFWQEAWPLTDSRALIQPQRSIFFALRGSHTQGSAFVGDLYARGVRRFVVEPGFDRSPYPLADFFAHSQPLALLQAWAAWRRAQSSALVIGITGSNAKTTIKEWLQQLLQTDYSLHKSPKSYNSQLGVALSVLGLEPEHRLAIFEAGISRPNEMTQLETMIRPDWGLFTNIGEAHREGFESQNQKISEKLRLFSRAQRLFYCADHLKIAQVLEQAPPWPAGQGPALWSWSTEGREAANLQFQLESGAEGQTLCRFHWAGQEELLELPFKHKAALENLLHALALLLNLGYEPTALQSRLAALEDLPMRLSWMRGINGCRLIDDSYNNDLGGLKIALDFLQTKDLQPGKGRVLILSDIPQAANEPEKIYRRLAEYLKVYQIQRFIGIGEALYRHQDLFELADKRFLPDTESFIRALDRGELQFEQETILVKGARAFAFERLSRRLRQQSHDTVLEMDLHKLRHNLQTYRRLLPLDCKLMVMVKAFAYGGGSVELARFLAHHRVDYLGVAYIDEGVKLRQKGIELPIMVMNPEPGGLEFLLPYRLEPAVYNLRHLREILAVLPTEVEQPLALHIELETGMHRLGFSPEDLDELLALLQTEAVRLRVQSCFSHLAAADEPEHEAFTKAQIARFEAGVSRLQAGLDQPFMRHILNSAGIVNYPQAHYEMVRLGIGLHGFDPSGALRDQLLPVASLKTRITQIHELSPEDSVGYSRRGRLTQGGRIGVLALGYADGFPRALGNGRAKVFLRGQKLPTIGNICMDMCFIDLSNLPQAREGDEVEVFGPNLPLENLATELQTIPYEVLTAISPRVPRIFFED